MTANERSIICDVANRVVIEELSDELCNYYFEPLEVVAGFGVAGT